jgi:hypothetical protein
VPLTWEERRALDIQEAAAQKKIAQQHAAEAQANDEWDALTRNYWPDEAAVALTAAAEKLAAGSLSQADHDALIVSINARTRGLATTPEAIKAAFDAQLAVARQDNATAVDSLTEAQFDALWESIK